MPYAGAAVGAAVFDSAAAVARHAAGESVVLVRRETNPDDLEGMIAASGVLTSRGGKTSHAAVVARGMGKTCVCGAEDLEVDLEHRTITAPDGTVVHEGDVLSIDGTSGRIFLGDVPVRPSPVVQYFEGELAPEDGDDLVKAVRTERPTLPMVMVSGYAELPKDAASGIPRLAKPFNEAGLAAAITSALATPGAEPSALH